MLPLSEPGTDGVASRAQPPEFGEQTDGVVAEFRFNSDEIEAPKRKKLCENLTVI